MRTAWARFAGVAAILCVVGIVVQAQAPGSQPSAGDRAGGQGAAPVAGGGAVAPVTPAVTPISRNAPVDAAAADLGKVLWSVNCITCHGTQARGTGRGPNLIRSEVGNYDHAAPRAGTALGSFLKKGHPTESGRPSASLTDDEVFQLANFVRQKINETMRGSAAYIVLPESILTGDAKAGEAFFKGAGTCTTCHNASLRSLDGIATRINSPQTLQGRVLYPAPAGAGGPRGGGGGRGAPAIVSPAPPPAGPQPPSPWATKVTIAPVTGPAVSGALTSEDSFFITYSEPSGVQHTVRKTPGMKITAENPMQWHLDFANRITDAQMHDLTAYLWSLK